jgi:radical SAM protein (TIGR01212 family)
MDLAGQWEHWRERLARKHKVRLFAAYLQSFSNTHGPVEKLAAVLAEIAELPGLAALCLGTRPDCLDGGKLALIADFPARETWLDLGLQSASDATLRRINRGHTAADFARAARAASRRGLLVCAHVMAGLPGEGREAFLATVRFVAALAESEGAVAGIKLHNLYVARDTPLSRDWEQGAYAPLALADYAAWAAEALALIPPDLVVHRIHADPAPGELLAPDWAADGGAVRRAVLSALDAVPSERAPDEERQQPSKKK